MSADANNTVSRLRRRTHVPLAQPPETTVASEPTASKGSKKKR